MNLKYRGIVYQTQAPQVTRTEKKLIGKYRGQDCYRAVYDTHLIPLCHPKLKYRGVAYRSVTQEVQPSVNAAAESTFKIEVPQYRKPVHSSRHQALSELDRVHNDFLLKKLEQRISSAQQKGDTSLVQMLEQEKNNIA